MTSRPLTLTQRRRLRAAERRAQAAQEAYDRAPKAKRWTDLGGKSRSSAAYQSWLSMRHRCLNEKHDAYPRYGGRGIKVCERWDSFENFLADMGERPDGTSIDRVNNDGDYEPGNCRWATTQEQFANRRNTRLITYQGVTQTLAELARSVGVARATLHRRIFRSGLSVEEALAIPLNPPHRRFRPLQSKCLRGHPMSGDNLAIVAGHIRRCRECEAIRKAARRDLRTKAVGEGGTP